MDTRRVTQITVLSLVGLTIVYDVVAVALWGVPSTVSRRVWYWSQGYPIVPFAVGVLCGHLFWAQHPDQDKKK